MGELETLVNRRDKVICSGGFDNMIYYPYLIALIILRLHVFTRTIPFMASD